MGVPTTPDAYRNLLRRVYRETKGIKKGKKATYIPELAKANASHYGISLCTIGGDLYNVGDHDVPFPIESISKLFSLAGAIAKHGTRHVFDKIGMHGSFMPFNSILAARLAPSHTINPFLNQGAMATTSLLHKPKLHDFKRGLVDGMSEFAGRRLSVGRNVYDSESKTHDVNMSLAYLLKSEKRFYAPVVPTVDAYTYQCSVEVTTDDLATMAAVFANGGRHPRTKRDLLTEAQASYILNNVLGEGLYEYSDNWIMETGGHAYAKSGVGGGLLIVIPNVCGIGVMSPRLGPEGNSVRGVAAGIRLSRALSQPTFAVFSDLAERRKLLRSRRRRRRRLAGTKRLPTSKAKR